MSTLGVRLREARKKTGMSLREVAGRVAYSFGMIGAVERDEQDPKSELVNDLASLYGVDAGYLMTGVSLGRTVEVVGAVRRGGIVARGEIERPMSVGLVPGLDADRVTALVIEVDTMAPAYRRGDVIFASSEESDPADCIGRDCLCVLADKRKVLRHIMPGTRPTKYTLVAYSGPAMSDMTVLSTKTILGLRRDAALGSAR